MQHDHYNTRGEQLLLALYYLMSMYFNVHIFQLDNMQRT